MPISLDGSGSISGISTFSFSDEIIHTGDTNTAIKFPATDTISFETNGAEALRITGNNNLLIGSSNESNNIRAGNKLAIVGTTPYIGMSITNYPGTTGNNAPMLDFNRSRGTSDQSMTSVAVDDKLGEIIFRGSDGSDFEDGTAIRAFVDATPANDTTDMPGRLTFCTSGDGDTTLHERVRIDSSGRLIVGSGSHGGGAQVVIKGGGVNTYSTLGMYSNHTNPTSGTLLSQIRFGSNATADGADIRVHADANWGTSDYPSRIGFYTAPDGSQSRHEGLRIDSGGRIFTGNDSTLLNSERGSLHVSGGGTQGSRISIRGTATGAGNGLAEVFAFWDTNKVAGMIAFAGEDTTNKDDGKLNFYTADGAGVQARMKISKEGYITKPNQPSFHVTLGGGQINSNVGVIVYTDTTTQINHNIGGHYSTSTGRFTAPVAGKYLITARMLTNSSTQSYTIYMIRRNGTYLGYIGHNHTDYWIMESGTFVMNLSANDYIDCYLVQHSGHGGYNYASFSGFLLG